MTDVNKLSMTNVNSVNDKCREKWSRKGADGSFQGQSMTNVDIWSMTNVDTWSMTNVNIVNDRCRQIVNDKFKLNQ